VSRTEPVVRILRAWGDPLDAEAAEDRPAPIPEEHVAILNRLFYRSRVDIGGLVDVDGTLYLCTKAGWRVAPTPEG
jgi:hypothetical protein